MSVIENALDKLRRSVAPRGATSDPVSSRGLVGTQTRAASAVPPAQSEQALKHITVDWAAVRDAGYLPAQDEDRRFAGHYRQIKRPLIEKALAPGSASDMRLILFSSALPGDGKTFTTVNLALSMARERDISVLLIDADAPRAQVSQIFGLRSEPGLIDALVDEALDVESLIVQTDIQGLNILPAGRFVENATELLASARMAQIAARITARNPRRVALLDSPPLLGSSEARALVQIPGQVVLVVRACETPRQAVLEAIALVEQKRFEGLILNEAPIRRGDGYYYEYSSYGVAGNRTAGAD